MPAFAAYAFPATGASTARTLPDRLADIINVKDFGAKGDDSFDDTPKVQDALNAAFGVASSPHGSAGALTNRQVFFPNGVYRINGTLNLTRVVGGRIYGAGPAATIIKQMDGNTALDINGASYLTVENLRFLGGGSNSPMIDLDWDNVAGGDGLHDNTFRNILFENFAAGILIAGSGYQGHNNLFEMCFLNGAPHTYAIKAHGAQAINNTTLGGGATGCTTAAYWSAGGSLHVIQPSLAGNVFDVKVDSGRPVAVIGGRTEPDNDPSYAFLQCTNGIVTVRSLLQTGSTTPPRVLANITGGQVSIEGVESNHVITGTGGTLYLRCKSLTNASLLTGYSGTVAQNI
jgi:hypothetical protein